MMLYLKKLVYAFLYNLLKLPKDYVCISYSQAGEDAVMAFLFNSLNLSTISYLEIGSNHPKYCNNTYLFYVSGGAGVCIEPDPFFFDMIKAARPRDKVLNIGVGLGDRNAELFIFNDRGLNTFSAAEADYRSRIGNVKVKERKVVELKTINEIIADNFTKTPDLVCIDIEGMDLPVIKSLDFVTHRPKVICIETVRYSNDNRKEKITEIFQFLESQSYIVYADTYINTIFVDDQVYLPARSPL
jgi:FkbM family methyltransferase